jgi:Skp family chaperone for outer membrane proteins
MSIKKIFGIFVLSFLTFNLLAEDLKIAFVDMDKVFQGYYKTPAATEELNKHVNIVREYGINLSKERDALHDEYKVLRDESQNIAYNEEVKEQKQKEAKLKLMLLQEKENEIRRYSQDKEREIQEKQLKQRNKLAKEISDFIHEFANNENYDLVLDSSGLTMNGIPAFVYYKKEMDITDTILSLINKGHQGEPIDSTVEDDQ